MWSNICFKHATGNTVQTLINLYAQTLFQTKARQTFTKLFIDEYGCLRNQMKPLSSLDELISDSPLYSYHFLHKVIKKHLILDLI